MKITKQFKMEVAHRLTSSYSTRCQSVHGHSYLMEVTLESEQLNEDGMVMDFGEVKDRMNHFFDAFDHSYVLSKDDVTLPFFLGIEAQIHNRMLVVDYNPTAENMAYHAFRAMVENSLPVSSVRVQETLTGWAVAERLKPFVGEDVTYYNIPGRSNA